MHRAGQPCCLHLKGSMSHSHIEMGWTQLHKPRGVSAKSHVTIIPRFQAGKIHFPHKDLISGERGGCGHGVRVWGNRLLLEHLTTWCS